MSGWLIKICGWDAPEPIRRFAVAESDPRAALVAVQKLTGAAPKLRLETVGPLSAQAIENLRLKDGQVLSLSA